MGNDNHTRNKKVVRICCMSFFAFACGFAVIQALAFTNNGKSSVAGGLVAGLIMAMFWPLAMPLLARGGRLKAAVIGAAFPYLACVVSVVGLGILGYMVSRWYIVVPIGIGLGLVTRLFLVLYDGKTDRGNE